MVAAFSHPQYVPGHMCQGDSGALYVVNAKEKSNPIVQLNCTTRPFTGPSKVISSGMADLFFMYYVPPPHKLIVITGATDSSHIKAISVETGNLTWEIKGKVDGEMCHPRGVLFSPQHDALLVADGKRCRVLVLHPRDGSHLKTIQLGWVMGVIVHLSWYHYQILVHHVTADKKEKVSLLEI